MARNKEVPKGKPLNEDLNRQGETSKAVARSSEI